MPEPTARNMAIVVLVAATVAAVLAAAVLLARQDDNAPIRIVAPEPQTNPLNSRPGALTQEGYT